MLPNCFHWEGQKGMERGVRSEAFCFYAFGFVPGLAFRGALETAAIGHRRPGPRGFIMLLRATQHCINDTWAMPVRELGNGGLLLAGELRPQTAASSTPYRARASALKAA
jgi:hypothetical protein